MSRDSSFYAKSVRYNIFTNGAPYVLALTVGWRASPGGTYSNMLAMNLARIKRFPESKTTGLSGLPKLVNFCSEQAHYSAKKNSMLLGFGEENSVAVKCDQRGKMIPEELEKCVLDAKSKVTCTCSSFLYFMKARAFQQIPKTNNFYCSWVSNTV